MEKILRIYLKIRNKKGSSEHIERSLFYHYFIMPFSAGIAGFAYFLFITMFLELTASLVGINNGVNIGITEVMISALGFILQFSYQLINSNNK